MVTRFIGIKEFRQNIAQIAKESRDKNERLIVLKRNEPILDVRPLTKKDITLEKLALDVKKAKEDVENGRVYTLEEAKKKLHL